MNVKITRQMPIEEIPEALNRLVNEIRTRIDVAKNTHITTDLTMGQKLEELRKKLLHADMAVEDAILIFNGYTNIVGRNNNADNDDNATSGANLPNQTR